MKRLSASEIAAFQRQYRFAGGRTLRLRLRYTDPDAPTAELILLVRTPIRNLADQPQAVRLKLRMVGVSEFRFQKRPTQPAGKISDFRLGYFDGQFYLNLDAFGLAPGEQPRLHDFRASEAYLAGVELWYEELLGKNASTR
ncbi:MAG: hypothetical protein LC104_05345 [Bacteroidales bacterium]|nr:hypothetical protein [Bacteroidales bacterium]